MELNKFWRDIKRYFTSWHRINNKDVPSWVLKLSEKQIPLGSGQSRIYKGKQYLYKEVSDYTQDKSYVNDGWYKKKRID